MKVALVGFEVEGRAAFQYWSKLGADITICDRDPDKQIPSGAKQQLGEDYLNNLGRFDLVWRTAGINPKIILKSNPDIASKISTTMNEFLRVCPTRHVIGVTGTKGKGTTSTLIAKMLEAYGKPVSLGGNIGLSPFDFLPELTEDSYVVLELSSFQLSDIKRSPWIAVCLTVAPEHLDWHHDLEDYISAKAHLFDYQTSDDIAVYYVKNDTSKRIASHSPGHKIPYFVDPGAYVENGTVIIAGQKICRTDELKLLGEHNWQNVCAAVTVVWQIAQNVEAIRSVLTTFSGLEHRLEFVREVNKVKYYNDSYGSAPDATIAALDAIPGTKVMIVGGFDRGIPLDPLIKAVNSHTYAIRKLIIIGASGKRLATELDKTGYSNYVTEPSKQMDAVVTKARSFATEGDSIVLSPGFASFDMFKNFTDRGLQYKSAVEAL